MLSRPLLMTGRSRRKGDRGTIEVQPTHPRQRHGQDSNGLTQSPNAKAPRRLLGERVEVPLGKMHT